MTCLLDLSLEGMEYMLLLLNPQVSSTVLSVSYTDHTTRCVSIHLAYV